MFGSWQDASRNNRKENIWKRLRSRQRVRPSVRHSSKLHRKSRGGQSPDARPDDETFSKGVGDFRRVVGLGLGRDVGRRVGTADRRSRDRRQSLVEIYFSTLVDNGSRVADLVLREGENRNELCGIFYFCGIDSGVSRDRPIFSSATVSGRVQGFGRVQGCGTVRGVRLAGVADRPEWNLREIGYSDHEILHERFERMRKVHQTRCRKIASSSKFLFWGRRTDGRFV